MKNEEILDRIDQLRDAIAYSRNENKIMNIGEGIYCNCEVAAWFRVLDGYRDTPHFVIPETIENKVVEINQIIAQTGWKRPRI